MMRQTQVLHGQHRREVERRVRLRVAQGKRPGGLDGAPQTGQPEVIARHRHRRRPSSGQGDLVQMLGVLTFFFCAIVQIQLNVTCISNDHPTENEADECFLGSVIERDEEVKDTGVGGGGGGGNNEAATERVCSLGGGEAADEREGG